MLKGLLITNPGTEKIAAKEVEEIIGKKSEIEESVVLFDVEKSEELMKLCYLSQSASKVVELLHVQDANLETALEKINSLDLSKWLNGTFVVRAKVYDNEDFDTLDTERQVGEVIHEKYNAKVNLNDPDVTFFICVYEEKLYFGIDYAGIELSKRSYRLFGLSDSIKATIAYDLVRISGYKPGQVFLDPFSHSGIIAIEAAHYATKKSVNYFNKDKFAFIKFRDCEPLFKQWDKYTEELKGITASDCQQFHVKASEKNAKIAGINKQINFSRMDTEWLDTKFEKGSVDHIVCNPPRATRLLTEKGLEKIFQEFFYTAEFILKPEGRMVLLTKNYSQIIKYAQRHNFILKGNLEVRQGKEDYNIIVFTKNQG
jgi:putative N6-adenine-specific DNA methylase